MKKEDKNKTKKYLP